MRCSAVNSLTLFNNSNTAVVVAVATHPTHAHMVGDFFFSFFPYGRSVTLSSSSSPLKTLFNSLSSFVFLILLLLLLHTTEASEGEGRREIVDKQKKEKERDSLLNLTGARAKQKDPGCMAADTNPDTQSHAALPKNQEKRKTKSFFYFERRETSNRPPCNSSSSLFASRIASGSAVVHRGLCRPSSDAPTMKCFCCCLFFLQLKLCGE